MIVDCGTNDHGKRLFGIRFNGPVVGASVYAAMAVASVATPDHQVRDWAVYMGGGQAEWDDEVLAGHIARYGQKLPHEWAIALFPHIEARYGVSYRA